MFAGKLIDCCEPYAKPGGIILTNSVFSYNLCMKECRENYELIGYIKRKKKRDYLEPESKVTKASKSKLHPKHNGWKYVDNEWYYLYRKSKK